MNAADTPMETGIGAFTLTPQELASPLWTRFQVALDEELKLLRAQNDAHMDIAQTTILRGQIRAIKRISARTEEAEVGRKSRQSEPDGPESASAGVATGFPRSFE